MPLSARSRLWLVAVALVGPMGCQTRVEVTVNRTFDRTERSIELRVHRAVAGTRCPEEADLGALTPEMDLGEIIGRHELVELPDGSWSRGADLGHVSDRVLVVAFGRAEDCTLVSAGCDVFDPAAPDAFDVSLLPRTAVAVQCTAPATCSDRFCRAPAAP